eukprot:3932716-Rhodomonas_salina.1
MTMRTTQGRRTLKIQATCFAGTEQLCNDLPSEAVKHWTAVCSERVGEIKAWYRLQCPQIPGGGAPASSA